MSEPKTPAPETLEAFVGVKPVPVVYRDGTAATVEVREVTIADLTAWVEAQDDETEMICISTGLARDQVMRLTLQSAEALVAVAEEMNGSFFQRFLARRKARTERVRSALGAS